MVDPTGSSLPALIERNDTDYQTSFQSQVCHLPLRQKGMTQTTRLSFSLRVLLLPPLHKKKNQRRIIKKLKIVH
ncbi:hypothetical protein Y1Q_0004408 [Alligator mississippiensis]|uniref:Uncharacterized protein n=1 Tax=Alligator mississippiensis TaxID=8496 RepID=A0A151MW81_ALLMI|nr:hypothetical protein Y1Q_0004408 [Alligator mississippiensis]